MELYHICNRSIESRNLFLDSQDYARFVHDMFEFNDTTPAGNAYRIFSLQMMDIGCPSSEGKRNRLVDIHGWCLMKDHYHLLLSERKPDGSALFMRKLNVGYSRYYNERYGRTGFVLRGKTKKVIIKNHAHFLYILHYVHLNPLDYLTGAKKWRERHKGTLTSNSKVLAHLEQHRWSSFLDYCGKKNFPSLLTKSLFEETPGEYYRNIRSYIADKEQLPTESELEP